MNKFTKFLSVLALAGTIGLQTTNVSALITKEECTNSGGTVHTNYYMFLDVNGADYYKTNIESQPSGTKFGHFTAADKYNNINLSQLISQANIPIKDSSGKTTYEEKSGVPTWTVEDYWKKFYTGSKNQITSNGDAGYYDDGNNTYLFHAKWYAYDNADFTGGGTLREHTSNNQGSSLMTFLGNNLNNLASSNLMLKGTSLPETKVQPAVDLDSTNDATQKFYVTRYFSTTEIKDGADVGNGQTVVYSPAVYMVEFCKTDGGTPVSDKKIEYDKNLDATVTDMPSTQTFKDECVNLSSNVPKADGYTFAGWAQDASAKSADYQPGAKYCGASITLHAVWIKDNKNPDGSYSITYDANGGKNAPAKQQANQGDACLVVSSAKPTHTTQTFLGWSRQQNATEPDSTYAAGKQYCGEHGDITLYAVYSAKTGVSAHVVGFGAVIIAAGTALIVAKKKNLFRQI